MIYLAIGLSLVSLGIGVYSLRQMRKNERLTETAFLILTNDINQTRENIQSIRFVLVKVPPQKESKNVN